MTAFYFLWSSVEDLEMSCSVVFRLQPAEQPSSMKVAPRNKIGKGPSKLRLVLRQQKHDYLLMDHEENIPRALSLNRKPTNWDFHSLKVLYSIKKQFVSSLVDNKSAVFF